MCSIGLLQQPGVFLQRSDDIFVYPMVRKNTFHTPKQAAMLSTGFWFIVLLQASCKDAAYDISSVASIRLPGDRSKARGSLILHTAKSV